MNAKQTKAKREDRASQKDIDRFRAEQRRRRAKREVASANFVRRLRTWESGFPQSTKLNHIHFSSGGKKYVSLLLPKLERWENGWKLEGTEHSDPAFGMWATLDGALNYIRQMREKIEETFQAETKVPRRKG